MKARSSISLSGRSRSDSKTLPPPFGLPGFAGSLDDQLVDERPLARAGAQQPADALDVLALAHSPGDDDPDLGVGDVDPFVEDLRRDQRPQRPGAKAVQHLLRARSRPMSQVSGMTRCSRATV